MFTRFQLTVATAVSLAIFTYTAPLLADQVNMRNGDIITGNISVIEDGEVFIEPSYAEKFAVDLAEVVSIDADRAFEIELKDGSKVNASFAHGEGGLQTLVIDGESRDIAMESLILAEEPEDWYDRTSHVDVNMTWNEGNTNSRNNLLYGDTSLKLGDHRHYSELTIRRDKTNDIYTKKQDLFKYTYGWLFNDPWYLGGIFNWERDPIRELDHRYTVGAVFGRDIFNDAKKFLTVSAGAGWSEEEFFATEPESGMVGLWSLRYEHDLKGGDISFFHRNSITDQYFGVENTIFKSNTGFRFDIIDDVYTNVSLRYDYETEPADGAENQDTTFVFGIGAEF